MSGRASDSTPKEKEPAPADRGRLVRSVAIGAYFDAFMAASAAASSARAPARMLYSP